MIFRSRRGGNAIEFALLAPVWIVVMMAILEYGWCFFVQATLERAVVEGARAGALAPQVDDVAGIAEAAAREAWAEVGVPAMPTFSVQLAGEVPYTTLTFDGSVVYSPLVGLGLLPTPPTLRAATRRMLEEP